MNNNLRIVIVDDDINSINLILSIIENGLPHDKVVGCATDLEHGMHLINLHRPDLVLLDMELGLEFGFDLLKGIDAVPVSLIVVSGYDKYALQAVRHGALDYILKPINPLELIDSIVRFKNTLDKKGYACTIKNLEQKIAIHSQKEINFISPDEILFCEAQNTYTKFVLKNEAEFEIISSKPIKEFETALFNFSIVRCHQSYLVNLKKISSIKKRRFSIELILLNKIAIPVSRQRKEWILDLLLNSDKKLQ